MTPKRKDRPIDLWDQYGDEELSMFGALAVLRAAGYKPGKPKDFARLKSIPFEQGFARTYLLGEVLDWAETIAANSRYVRAVDLHGPQLFGAVGRAG